MLKLARVGVPLAFLLLLTSCARQEQALPAPELVQGGWNDYRLGEYNRAIEKFQQAVDTTEGGSDLHLQALYGLASTWNLRLPLPDQDKELAKRLYEEIVSSAPNHDLAAWSLLALARMKHVVPVGQEPDYDEVRKAYRDIIDRFGDHLAAQEAFVYLTATYVATLDPALTRQALADLKAYVKAHPDTAFLSACYSLMAVSYTTLGEQQNRLEAEIHALENMEVDPTNPRQELSWQYWNIATIAEFEVGDFDVARAYYRKLIEEYPQDQKIYGAKVALERMDRIEQDLRRELAKGGS